MMDLQITRVMFANKRSTINTHNSNRQYFYVLIAEYCFYCTYTSFLKLVENLASYTQYVKILNLFLKYSCGSINAHASFLQANTNIEATSFAPFANDSI